MSEVPGSTPGLNDQPRPFALDDAQLAQINRLTTIARFVSGLAHELNNSLQVMGGLVELLADRTDLPADAAVRIQKIGGQVDRANGVIRQVVAYTRDGATDVTAIDLAATADRAMALRRYQLGRNGVTINWDRQAGQTFRVRGDERQLQQLVLNLLVNAEEALQGQPDRRLRMTLNRAPGRISLSVEDSGPGVPADLRDRIFEPFVTTRSSTRAIGLGLTVGAAIAAAHGGRLYLADTAPGATFVADFPSAEA
jgi:two-component system C4-dicarboxylate transport sensor histidine kinase DctB